MFPSSNELRYFVEIASTLNFTRAAERLGITQPSLTSAIKSLEHQMETTLFVRHKKGVTLTPAGIFLKKNASSLLESWENIKKNSKESMEEIAGHFTFGVHPSVALFTLPHFLGNVLLNNPKLHIDLIHDHSRKILEQVISHKVDIGIVVNPIRHPDLIIKKLYEDKVGFWIHPKLLERQGSSDAHIVSLLEKVPLFSDLELGQTESLMNKLKQGNKEIKPKRIVPTNNLEVIATLALAGAGIGILPERVMKTFDHQNKMILIETLPIFLDTHSLIYRVEQKNIKSIRFLTDEITKSLKSS